MWKMQQLFVAIEKVHIQMLRQRIDSCSQKLIELIKHPKNVTPVYKKLPMILGGEQSVSADEPVKSFNVLLNKEEEDERILSCSWHVGYIRHDCPEAGCGIVVVPNGNSNYEYANEVADKLATYIVFKTT